VTATPKSQAVSPADLARTATLPASELAGSWEPTGDGNPEASPGQRSSRPECSYQGNALTDSSVGYADAAWRDTTGAATEMVTSQVYAYETAAAAGDALDRYAARVRGCRRWEAGGTDRGYAFEHRQRRTTLGDGRILIGREVTVGSIAFPDTPTVTMYQAAGRAGNVVTVTSYTPSPDVAAPAARGTLSRYAGAALKRARSVTDR
jgi:hypothetical protein